MKRWRSATLLGLALILVPGINTTCYAAFQEQQPAAIPNNQKPDAQVASDSDADSDSSSKHAKNSVNPSAYDNGLGLHLAGRFLGDQKAIWTSPAHIHLSDADWLMPLGLITAFTLSTDTEFSKHLSNSPSRLSHSNTFSTDAVVGMGGLAGGIYLWGQISHDEHKKETGLLAGEAAANSFAMIYALKYVFQRERPLRDGYRGGFWKGGDGFPSEHAAAAWSIASVIAHEYPSPLTDILAYGTASAISVSRLTAKQHFPTDVLIGSAIGWFSGEVIYRNHHDPDLSGSTWQTFAESRDYLERDRPRQSMGTTFVPLDSWVYSAFDRLAGLGYVHSGLVGMRPWTRMECARLTEEASEELRDTGAANDGANDLVSRLEGEFAYEVNLLDGGRNVTANLESVYVRAVSISGPALTDSFHFGQTVSYDFGRPFERGTNGQAGGSFRAAVGPIAIYIRTEYQHAPAAPAPSDAVRSIIALRDMVPEPPAVPVAAIDRPRLLDAYVGVNLNNWQLLFGKQNLDWGPGLEGSLLFSDNAEPIDMVRLVNSEPFQLPTFFKYLGPVRFDQFVGRLGGDTFVRRPFLYGNKISFKPLPNLEIGFGRTCILGGKGGDPFTPANFFDSFFGQLGSNTAGHSVPGDNRDSVDWTFNVPKVRNYIVFYGEWYAGDDPIAIENPKKSAYHPGIYITHFPGIPKLDFHMEAANTESPEVLGGNHGDLNYWNFGYRDGYTNNKFLIGNVVGRMGEAYQGWLTYWVSPRNTWQFVYKNNEVASAFIPGGGGWQDYGVRNEFYWNSGIYLKSQVQYEHISHYPILFKGPENNVTAFFELGFWPSSKKKAEPSDD